MSHCETCLLCIITVVNKDGYLSAEEPDKKWKAKTVITLVVYGAKLNKQQRRIIYPWY